MSFIEIAQASFNTMSDIDSPIFTNNMEFGDFILLVISIFVLISWMLSIVFILYWWLLLILSWGKEDKIKPAINTIRYAVLGLIITVASIFLFPILGKLLWIDVEQYAKPARIFDKIEDIWNKVFWWWKDYSIHKNIDDHELPSDFSDL